MRSCAALACDVANLIDGSVKSTQPHLGCQKSRRLPFLSGWAVDAQQVFQECQIRAEVYIGYIDIHLLCRRLRQHCADHFNHPGKVFFGDDQGGQETHHGQPGRQRHHPQ
jgi:hypothetical protein